MRLLHLCQSCDVWYAFVRTVGLTSPLSTDTLLWKDRMYRRFPLLVALMLQSLEVALQAWRWLTTCCRSRVFVWRFTTRLWLVMAERVRLREGKCTSRAMSRFLTVRRGRRTKYLLSSSSLAHDDKILSPRSLKTTTNLLWAQYPVLICESSLSYHFFIS